MGSRQELKIKDTGLAYVGESSPTRDRVYSGNWITLYGAKISYDQEARIGQKEERVLSTPSNHASPFTYNDVTHFGVGYPKINISGSLDVSDETTTPTQPQIIGYLFEMLASQGLKELQGDFVGYTTVAGSTVYVRITKVSINPPRYDNGKSRINYTIDCVRVL